MQQKQQPIIIIIITLSIREDDCILCSNRISVQQHPSKSEAGEAEVKATKLCMCTRIMREELDNFCRASIFGQIRKIRRMDG